jgi:DNA modification methylase
MTYNLLLGDCLEQLKTLPDCSVDSIVTDPPYGISFMNRKWDYDIAQTRISNEESSSISPLDQISAGL